MGTREFMTESATRRPLWPIASPIQSLAMAWLRSSTSRIIPRPGMARALGAGAAASTACGAAAGVGAEAAVATRPDAGRTTCAACGGDPAIGGWYSVINPAGGWPGAGGCLSAIRRALRSAGRPGALVRSDNPPHNPRDKEEPKDA